jgi:hypothetical protein
MAAHGRRPHPLAWILKVAIAETSYNERLVQCEWGKELKSINSYDNQYCTLWILHRDPKIDSESYPHESWCSKYHRGHEPKSVAPTTSELSAMLDSGDNKDARPCATQTCKIPHSSFHHTLQHSILDSQFQPKGKWIWAQEMKTQFLIGCSYSNKWQYLSSYSCNKWQGHTDVYIPSRTN